MLQPLDLPGTPTMMVDSDFDTLNRTQTSQYQGVCNDFGSFSLEPGLGVHLSRLISMFRCCASPRDGTEQDQLGSRLVCGSSVLCCVVKMLYRFWEPLCESWGKSWRVVQLCPGFAFLTLPTSYIQQHPNLISDAKSLSPEQSFPQSFPPAIKEKIGPSQVKRRCLEMCFIR